MSAARTPAETMAMMARETRFAHGPVPHELGGFGVPPGHRMIAGGQFLLRCESGYGYLYVPGEGVTIERPDGADPDEESLWLNGSVYSAVACLNGLLPIHASAVVAGGQVHAFTGPSGAGKSTLVAALGGLGLPMFADDTLVLDLSDPERVIALPGHKRLKLTAEALTLTGSGAEAPVGAETDKFYAQPLAGEVDQPLPLARLVFLAEGEELGWREIAGAERLVRLDDDHYTQAIHAEAQAPTRSELFSLRSRIARQVAMVELIRPHCRDRFAASARFAAARLTPLEIDP